VLVEASCDASATQSRVGKFREPGSSAIATLATASRCRRQARAKLVTAASSGGAFPLGTHRDKSVIYHAPSKRQATFGSLVRSVVTASTEKVQLKIEDSSHRHRTAARRCCRQCDGTRIHD